MRSPSSSASRAPARSSAGPTRATTCRTRRDDSVQVPYRVVTRGLADAGVPYDVVIFPDGVTAPDRVSEDSLSRYRTVVLPDCHYLTDQQAAALHGYLDGGGCAVVTGGLGDNLEPEVRGPLSTHPGLRRTVLDDLAALTPFGPQVTTSADLAVNVARLADGSAAVHLLNYGYDRDADAVRPRRRRRADRPAAVRARHGHAGEPRRRSGAAGRRGRPRVGHSAADLAAALRCRRVRGGWPDDGDEDCGLNRARGVLG